MRRGFPEESDSGKGKDRWGGQLHIMSTVPVFHTLTITHSDKYFTHTHTHTWISIKRKQESHGIIFNSYYIP